MGGLTAESKGRFDEAEYRCQLNSEPVLVSR
jgi:hypothetical protein